MKKFDFSEGKELGEKLRRIENHWIENDFKITEDEIEKIVKTKYTLHLLFQNF